MKKLSNILVLAVVAVFVMAVSAMALPSNLEDITGISGTNIYTDTGAEAVYLTHTGVANPDATAFLFFEFSAWDGTNTFGIYDYTTNPDGSITVGDMLEVFDGAASPLPLTSITLQWDSTISTVTNQGTGLSADIDDTFGFYLGTAAVGTWYSHTSLNIEANGASQDHAMLFDTTDNSVGALLGADVVIAFEDLDSSIGSDFDYNDMVVGVSDVAPAPVPEPSTVMLVGTGLLGMIAFGRKRFNKKT